MEQFHEAEEELNIEINTENGHTIYRVNGREYSSIDELPPEARRVVEEIQNKPGIKDGFVIDGPATYEINGVTYGSLDEVPPEFHDILLGLQSGGGTIPDKHTVKKSSEHYFINGKEYGSLDELPPALRSKIEKLPQGPSTTIEYITSDGVTRKFINGREASMRPGEQAPGDNRKRYGDVHLDDSQASIYHKIRASRSDTPGDVSEIDSLSEASLLAEESRRATIILIGRLITTAAYLALIIWSLYQPAGLSSYFYLGFLIGDIATWLIFSVWGWQKSMVEFSFKDLAIHAGGLLFFILLNTREGSFVVARDLRNEAIAILLTVAVITGAAKWVARFFGLIRRITEGF